MKFFSTDSQDNAAIVLLAANSLASGFKNVVDLVAPALAAVLILTQIVVALVTVVWIWRRAAGAKLENNAAKRRGNKKA